MDTLELIGKEVRSCTKCRLHQGTRNGVPGEGNAQTEILFVGEGPGQQEDIQGKPFVGAAGKLLTEMLDRAGLKRDDVFITNIVKHRPPGNRDPMPDEMEACTGYLERQISLIDPRLIVTLGRHSMGYFFGPNARITKIHGTAQPWRDKLVYACFHPAAALHQPKYREFLEQDFDGLPGALEAARKRAREKASENAAPKSAETSPPEPEDGDGPSSQLSLF